MKPALFPVSYSKLTRNTRVYCCKCNNTVEIERAYADRNGPAFKAYWCPKCVAEHQREDPA